MFLFDEVPGGRWTLVVLAVAAWIVLLRVLKHHRRREQLRRRRQIRARLHGTELAEVATAPAADTDLTDAAEVATAPAADTDLTDAAEIDLTGPAREIDLRDRVIYGSEVTLESGDTLESGIVGPFRAE